MRSELPELLTGAESRQLIGISSAIWMELLETGKLPNPVVVGERRKWRKTDILQWINQINTVDLFHGDGGRDHA